MASLKSTKHLRQSVQIAHARRYPAFATGLGTEPGFRPSVLVKASGAEPLSQSAADMVSNAAACVQRCESQRCLVNLLLPINEKETAFMATELGDYPCSIQREFDVAVAVTKALLGKCVEVDASTLVVKRLDQGGVEGEPCAVVSTPSKEMAAVVYPTADNLKAIKSLAENASCKLLIVNPQWNLTQGIVSDFGFGPWRARTEEFLASFEEAFTLVEQRIGAPGSIDAVTGQRFVSGGVVRLQRCYPHPYLAYVLAPDGSNQFLKEMGPRRPGYEELDAALKEGREAKLDIFSVASKVAGVAAGEDGRSTEAGVEVDGEGGLPDREALSEADVSMMDAVTLRRELGRMGLPTSGKAEKLRARLLEAQG